MKTRKPWGPKTDLFHQPPVPKEKPTEPCPEQYAVGTAPVSYAQRKLNLKELSKQLKTHHYDNLHCK